MDDLKDTMAEWTLASIAYVIAILLMLVVGTKQMLSLIAQYWRLD